MALTLEALVKRFGGEIVGDAQCKVSGLAPLDQAGPQQLAFLANPKYLSQVEKGGAGAVLIAPKDLEKLGAAEGSPTSGPRMAGPRTAGPSNFIVTA
ncbi:LpxD N-terminal domain-containing protein, partial [Burkholderia gladioli]|uniref:LpxD N-terminal domain-containing protein n=1 Tax=Burkholderia gladioli TaxID=28095 RepID=UPI00244650B1